MIKTLEIISKSKHLKERGVSTLSVPNISPCLLLVRNYQKVENHCCSVCLIDLCMLRCATYIVRIILLSVRKVYV